MSWLVTAAVVGAGVSLYSAYESNQNAKEGLSNQKDEQDRQYNLQLQREKDLKDRQSNDQSLESAKIVRSRRQALLFGGATKNNTIMTSPNGVSTGGPSTSLGVAGTNPGVSSAGGISGGGAKSLLGM